MTLQDDLHRDYDQLAKDLTARFGTEFTIDSTGGGFYALAASIEGGYLLITNGNGNDGLEDRQQMEGWAVGVHIDGEQKVYLRRPDPRGLMLIIDDDELAKEMGDTIGQALRAVTFKPGTKVRHRRWDAVGTIEAFPAVDPEDGFRHIDMAEVTWSADHFEVEDLYDLI